MIEILISPGRLPTPRPGLLDRTVADSLLAVEPKSKLTSITQDLGDDPMSVMVRRVFALIIEYRSNENAKHVLCAMQENARQGFRNGARPPFGYTLVVAE